MPNRPIGLIVVGDEILSGRRQDAHLSHFITLLNARGLQLAWAQFLPDDFDVLVQAYERSFASGDIVFSSGGIGSTPDDKTREAAAAALKLPLTLHPEAARCITERAQQMAAQGQGSADMGTPENQRRLAMGLFPKGADTVPNPYNHIPGFFIRDHTFVPGFPEMAWPMMAWTLDHRYGHLHKAQAEELMSVNVYGIPESRITPVLEWIEKEWPNVRTFSLPVLPTDDHPQYIDIGVKGENVKEAFDYLRGQILRVGGHFSPKR